MSSSVSGCRGDVCVPAGGCVFDVTSAHTHGHKSRFYAGRHEALPPAAPASEVTNRKSECASDPDRFIFGDGRC